MGLLDFLLSKRMQKRKIAQEIGVESGLFISCPICHDVTEAPDPSLHRPATETLVRELIRERDSRLALFDYSETAVIETVAEVGRDLPYHCLCHSI